MSVRLVFIGVDDRLAGWWQVENGAIAARGGAGDPLPADPPARVVAIAPAAAIGVHAAELGTLAPAQARAAARLLVQETAIAPLAGEHVAVGPPEAGDRIVAVVAVARLAAWIAMLDEAGLNPDAIVPAALVLPRPELGYLRATIGDEGVIRGRATGFFDDPALTPLVVGSEPVETIDATPLLLAAAENPPFDLLQGPFARRRRVGLDHAQLRRLGILAAATLVVTLLIALVQLVRLEADTRALEAQADAVAARATPGGTAGSLAARLASVRGPGHGFSATAGALFAALQASPAVELAALDFTSDGLLRATLLAPGAAEVEAVRDRLRSAGLAVEPSTFQSESGRIRGELRITPR